MTNLFCPPSSVLLRVPHRQQQHSGECLAACVAMLLTYYDAPYDYQQLIKTLRIQIDLGAPFPNILYLEQLGVLVGYRTDGTLATLHRLLTYGWPVLIAVDTGELPHWQISTGHAVTLVGMDQSFAYVNDPEMLVAPTPVPLADFYLAWFEQACSYAVLSTP